MNKYILIILIGFFIVALTIGITAIIQDIRPDSRANSTCTPQEFPENMTCPEEQKIELVKDPNGCFVFSCN